MMTTTQATSLTPGELVYIPAEVELWRFMRDSQSHKLEWTGGCSKTQKPTLAPFLERIEEDTPIFSGALKVLFNGGHWLVPLKDVFLYDMEDRNDY